MKESLSQQLLATRRQIIATGLLGASALAVMSPSLSAEDKFSGAADIPADAIHMEEDFSVPPAQVYEALLDSKQFAAFTHGAAEIDRASGGAFKLFDDRIVGRNIELIPNQRVVQAWREPSWAEGIYSIVKFELKSHETGTRIVFDHWGFPQAARPHLLIGWKEHYWDGMRKYFKG